MKLLIIIGLLTSIVTVAQKPKVWIYSDMSDKTLKGNDHGTVNDPDDISCMASYLLMSNMFETMGIVISSTHRQEHKLSPDQADWANNLFGSAYRADVTNLNKNIGGYADEVHFVQSCIKESAELYDSQKKYKSINKYSTVKSLLEVLENQNDIINVLCWGSLTEPAILVNYCLTNGRSDILQKLRFFGAWTNSSLRQGTPEHPENVSNCREDAAACAYLKRLALNGTIEYYECAATGQHGIVSGSPKGEAYFNQFKTGHLGKIFAEGKYAFDCIDFCDATTYWVLLGNWGVSMNDVKRNGTNFSEIEQENEKRFFDWSYRIHDELLRRSKAAVE